MKQLLGGLVFLFFICNSFAQKNFVANGNFEQYSVCPTQFNIQLPTYWYRPSNSNYPVYLNGCSPNSCCGVPYSYWGTISYQPSLSGSGYVGLTYYYEIDEWRTYIQSKLLDSLKVGKNYYIEFYVNLANPVKYGCNNISLLFTNNPVYQDTINDPTGVIHANAQIFNYGNTVITDTLNWVKVSSIYKAQGGEQYITLGNFKSNTQTATKINVNSASNAEAGYYIDDVFVIPLDSMPLKANAGKDTTITVGDSVFIGSLTNGIDSLLWLQNGVLKIDSIRPGFWVQPLANTCYVLTQTVNGYASSDTVCINVLPLPLKFTNYELRSTNETRNGINEKQVTNNWSTANEINVSHFNILKSTDGINFKVIGKVKANNKNYNEYNFIDNKLPITSDQLTIYYRIESVDFNGRKQFSEVRNIEHRTRNNELRIYPNPAKDFVTIECKGAKELLIIDYLGRVVVYKQILRQAQNDNNQRIIINVQGLYKGLYLVKVITADGVVKTDKLIVQ